MFMNKLEKTTKFIIGLIVLAVLSVGNSNAQSSYKYDSLRKWGAVKWENEYLWRMTGNKKYQAYDTLSKSEFKALSKKYAVKELTDYDTAYQHFILMKRRPPYQTGLKTTFTIGPAVPYCGSWDGTDKTMFLKTGYGAGVALDYFFGKLGIGTLFGYQHFGVDKSAHQTEMYKVAAAYGIPQSQVGFSDYKAYESMMALVGPVLSLPIGKKVVFDLGAKGGIFRNDPAFLQAVNLANGKAIQQVYGSNRRNYLGYNIGLALLYRLTDNWSAGLAADIFSTKTKYQTLGASGRSSVDDGQPLGFSRLSGGYRLGLALAYKFADNKVVAIAPLTPPNCAAPIIEDGLNGKTFDNNTYERPVFKWKSGSTSGGDESYTFKLYKKGNTNPIYQTTTNLTTVLWPSDVPFAKEPGFYYYTVHSSRANKGGTCMSEMATASFSVPEPIRERIVEKIVDCSKFTHKIYGGEVMQTYSVKRVIKDTICTCNDKDLYEYKYITKRRKKDAKVEAYISGYSKSFDKTDLKAELPADFELPAQRSSFVYEIQQAPCGPDNTAGRVVAKYKIYVGNKGRYQGIYKIDQLPVQ